MKPFTVLIDGLPGAGKNYVCSKLRDALGKSCSGQVAYMDIDDASQSILNDPKLKTAVQRANKIKKKLTEFINSNSSMKVILICGVSAVVDSDNGLLQATFPKVDMKLWLDIVPRDRHGNPVFAKGIDFKNLKLSADTKDELDRCDVDTVTEVFESARRAMLREFRPKERKEWIDMPKDDRVGFYHMNPPSALANDEFEAELRAPLKDYLVTTHEYHKYFIAMVDDIVADNYTKNRHFDLANHFRAVHVNRDARDVVREIRCRLVCRGMIGCGGQDECRCGKSRKNNKSSDKHGNHGTTPGTTSKKGNKKSSGRKKAGKKQAGKTTKFYMPNRSVLVPGP